MRYWQPDRTTTDRLLHPLARLVLRIPGISPAWISTIGLFFAVLASFLIATGQMAWGALFVLFSGLMDVLDGYVARSLRMESQKGAFLDSCLDRLADGALFFGALWYFLDLGDREGVLLSAGSMVGALITPYIRAKAEQFLTTGRAGLLERPHRMGFLILGLALNLLKPTLGIILVLSFVTIFQRLVFTLRRLS